MKWNRSERIGSAWVTLLGGTFFLLTQHKIKYKLLLPLVSLCLALPGILNKEDGVLTEQKLLGVRMAREKEKSGLLAEPKAKQKSQLEGKVKS